MHKTKSFLAVVATGLLLAGNAGAAIPRIISSQGRLADASGTPMQSTVDMTFKIYPAGSGTACFTEAKTVALRNGLFSVAVGADTAGGIAATCDFRSGYEVEIQVGTDSPMTPRIALAASPYAIAASRVGVLTADETNNRIGIGTTAPAYTLDVAGVTRSTTSVAGSAASDYLPASSNWNYTLRLDAMNVSSIGFHDAGNSASSIRYDNNGFVIGGDDGWGVRPVSMPGNLTVSGTITANGGRATVYTLNVACGAGLTTSATCSRQACGWNSYGVPNKAYTCGTTTCVAGVTGTCTNTFVGYLP